jgi:hypothetical protein
MQSGVSYIIYEVFYTMCWSVAESKTVISRTLRLWHGRLTTTILVAVTIGTIARPVDSQPHERVYSACAGINRSLTKERAMDLAPLIAKQLRSPNPSVEGTSAIESAAGLEVQVLESFNFQGWFILFVSTHVSEPVYLFYSQLPENSKFVALYGGAAGYDPDDPNGASKAEHEVTSWLRKEMPKIPQHLADCFAWHFVVEARR